MEKKNIKIFVASSAEVSDEREKCILILNQINKSHTHLDLEAIEWEYDLTHGSHPNFKSIQKAINPLLEQCQLCVFIFHTKIGKYTREEFELTHQLQKKIIPFFKEGFAPKTKEEITKLSELIDFREGLNETVLYKNYTDLNQFELLLKDDLHLYLSQEFPVKANYENKSLPAEVSALVKIITEKQEEIDQLKGSMQLPDETTRQQLTLLEQQIQELQVELNKSKEFQEQQSKDKKDLELRLAPQLEKDNLKQQAYTALQENNFDEAKELLKKSAKESITETATTFYELGKVSKLQLNYKEALNYFELAVKINPNDFDMNMELGVIEQELGLYKNAIIHFEKALEFLDSNNQDNQSNLAYVNNELGSAYNNIGQYDKAIDFYKKTLKIVIKIYGTNHPSIAVRFNNLGLAYNNKGEYDKAIDYYKKALKIDLKNYGDEQHSEIAIRYNNLGLAYSNKEQYDKAIDYYEKALKIDLKIYGEEHPDTAIDYNNLGMAYNHIGEYNDANTFLMKGLLIDLKIYGEEHPQIAIRYNNIGMVHDNKDEYEKAIDYYKKALAIDLKIYGEEHPSIGIRYNNLGSSYNSKNEQDKAIYYYEKALLIFRSFLPSNHPYINTTERNLAQAQQKS